MGKGEGCGFDNTVPGDDPVTMGPDGLSRGGMANGDFDVAQSLDSPIVVDDSIEV